MMRYGWFVVVMLGICGALPVAAAGTINTIAGAGGGSDNGGSGPALDTNINQPFGLEIGPDGALYICERGLHRIRRLDMATGEVTTYAGTGVKGYRGDGGPADKAELNEPHELRFDDQGHLYFTDMRNHVVRKVDWQTKQISTFAGTGELGFSGDGGPAHQAQLAQPHSVALDGRGSLYIADIGNHRIRRVDLATGVIETIGGTGERKLPRDGVTAAGEPILGPRALFVDGNDLWVALREGSAVYRIDLTLGTIHHVAGTGKKGYGPSDGPAKDCEMNSPKGIAVGPDKLVYLVDSSNHAIRVIDPRAGTIRTIAGQGAKKGFGGDGGDAQNSLLNNPHAIFTAADGTLYIGDSDNHRVRRIRP